VTSDRTEPNTPPAAPSGVGHAARQVLERVVHLLIGADRVDQALEPVLLLEVLPEAGKRPDELLQLPPHRRRRRRDEQEHGREEPGEHGQGGAPAPPAPGHQARDDRIEPQRQDRGEEDREQGAQREDRQRDERTDRDYDEHGARADDDLHALRRHGRHPGGRGAGAASSGRDERTADFTRRE
jgi:hypothetical protein